MAQLWPPGMQRIEVLAQRPDAVPALFHWHARRMTVRAVLQDWIAEGDWWLEHAGERYRYAVVQCERAVLTLVQDLATPDAWSVVRLMD